VPLRSAAAAMTRLTGPVKGTLVPKVTFDEILEAVEHLPVDEQADLLEVVRRRLTERGHRRLIEDISEACTQFGGGTAKPATVDEIMREIES
jgi:hypothetical protein